MFDTQPFFQCLLNSISDSIAVIDREGVIHYTNKSWDKFGSDNLLPRSWFGSNYLKACDDAARAGDQLAARASDGIRSVIGGLKESFLLEYPCEFQNIRYWFQMQVNPLECVSSGYTIIAHQDITERKRTEEQILALSKIDCLTGISNRRHFDEFLRSEWKRCQRQNQPISLAMLDIDHFKALNDNYGHVSGDECLKKIGAVLSRYTRRPSDLCARFGGEEFSVVLGNTALDEAEQIVESLLSDIRSLKIPNVKSPIAPIVTVSAGLTTVWPTRDIDETSGVEAADILLYASKAKGGDQISCRILA